MVGIWSQIWSIISDGSRDFAMVTNFRVKIGKIGLFTFIRSHGIPKRIAILPFWSVALFVNLVNFGPVTPEFNIAKDVHPVVSFFKINLSDKSSQDPLDRFHRIISLW